MRRAMVSVWRRRSEIPKTAAAMLRHMVAMSMMALAAGCGCSWGVEDSMVAWLVVWLVVMWMVSVLD